MDNRIISIGVLVILLVGFVGGFIYLNVFYDDGSDEEEEETEEETESTDSMIVLSSPCYGIPAVPAVYSVCDAAVLTAADA